MGSPSVRFRGSLLSIALLSAVTLFLTASLPGRANADTTIDYFRGYQNLFSNPRALALDQNGSFYLAYMDNSISLNLILATRSSTCPWTLSGPVDSNDLPGGVGPQVAIAVSGATAWIAYLVPIAGTSTSFRLSVATTTDYKDFAIHSIMDVPGDTVANISSALLAIKVDGSGVAHVLCGRSASGGIMDHILHATCDASGNTTINPVPMPGGPGNEITGFDVGKYGNALAIDSQGDLYAVYSFRANSDGSQRGEYTHLPHGGSTWDTPIALESSAGNAGDGCSIALSSAGYPRIAYVDHPSTGPSKLRLKWKGIGSSWQYADLPLDAPASTGYNNYTAIIDNASDIPGVAYWATNTNNVCVLEYAELTGGLSCASSGLCWSPLDSRSSRQVAQETPVTMSLNANGHGTFCYGEYVNSYTAYPQTIEYLNSTADGGAPAAVNNLAATVGKTTVNLTWTAVGDDGHTGTARDYDVRTSATAITNDTQFAAATPLTPGCVSANGLQDCLSVSGLSPCTTHHYALKVRDNVGNLSALSNDVSITTHCSGSEVFGCEPGVIGTRDPENASPAISEALALNVENPARGEFVAQLSIPTRLRGQLASLAVHDLQGRLIHRQDPGSVGSGMTTLRWDLHGSDGSRVGRGVYFVRVRVGSETVDRTLVVLP